MYSEQFRIRVANITCGFVYVYVRYHLIDVYCSLFIHHCFYLLRCRRITSDHIMMNEERRIHICDLTCNRYVLFIVYSSLFDLIFNRYVLLIVYSSLFDLIFNRYVLFIVYSSLFDLIFNRYVLFIVY